MAKGLVFDNALLLLIFNSIGVATICDAPSAVNSLGNLFVSLHSSDPTASGNQTSSEISYPGYARVAVARTSGGWTVTSNSVSPVANIIFPTGTGGSGTATNWSVGTALSGSGQILYTGTIAPGIVCGNGLSPILTTATVISEQ
jgi:hypothetical protein